MLAAENNYTNISVKNLTRIYYIIPFSVILILCDVLFFKHYLRVNLPHSTKEVAYYTIIFGLPHVFCSIVILFSDKTYIAHYKNQFVPALILIAMFTMVTPYFLPQNMILAINAIVTTNHGMGQQFGLTSAIARYKGAYFTWWKSLGLIINNLVYFLFYFSIKIKPNILQDLLILTAGLMAIFLILTVYMNKQITRREGTTYSWYAFSLIFFAFLMVFSGYKFFAMLVTRVIHDLTAFYFYNTHNVNKWYDNKNSKIHAWLVSGKFIKYAIVFLITPLMAIIVARGISLFASFTILNCISLFHYWTESFTWKNGTPHRKFIPMA